MHHLRFTVSASAAGTLGYLLVRQGAAAAAPPTPCWLQVRISLGFIQ